MKFWFPLIFYDDIENYDEFSFRETYLSDRKETVGNECSLCIAPLYLQVLFQDQTSFQILNSLLLSDHDIVSDIGNLSLLCQILLDFAHNSVDVENKLVPRNTDTEHYKGKITLLLN